MDLTTVLLEQVKKQALEKITKKIGGDSEVAGQLIEQALPAILGQLSKNTKTKKGTKSLDKALDSHSKENEKISIADGKKILSHIFGDKQKEITKKTAKDNSLKQTETKDSLAILASTVLSTLGTEKSEGNIDTSGISELLKSASKNKMLTGFLDQNNDGKLDKNDIFSVALKFLKDKFLGGNKK